MNDNDQWSLSLFFCCFCFLSNMLDHFPYFFSPFVCLFKWIKFIIIIIIMMITRKRFFFFLLFFFSSAFSNVHCCCCCWPLDMGYPWSMMIWPPYSCQKKNCWNKIDYCHCVHVCVCVFVFVCMFGQSFSHQEFIHFFHNDNHSLTLSS